MSDEQFKCALDLMRRMPPERTEEHLSGLIDLVPDLTETLLSTVDQPLKVAFDKKSKRDYLLCDYNRDGDSYRSPWSNKYDPALDDGAVPSKELREMEVHANELFDVYREMYYEGGVSSVYMWDLDTGFAACVLFKKAGTAAKRGAVQGSWDSLHVVEVDDKGKSGYYKMTSTVMLNLTTKSDTAGNVVLAGSLTRQTEQQLPVSKDNTHVSNLGKMVEDMEGRLRSQLEVVYFSKTRDIVTNIREPQGMNEKRRRDQVQGKVAGGLESYNEAPSNPYVPRKT